MEQHVKPAAQETLDQITDIITNRYEAEVSYTAEELAQILDAIVAILDRRLAEPQPDNPREQADLCEPLVLATIHSDDRA